MSFIETPRFPDDVGFGAQGGPSFLTRMAISQSGAEQRQAQWSLARMRYNVSHAVNTQAEIETMVAFFRSMQGRTHGFRFKDWADYQVSSATGWVTSSGVGNNGLPTANINKYYESGALSSLRPITKPVSGSVGFWYGGSSSAVPTSLDHTLGLVTFGAISSRAVSSVSVGASTIVTLASALSPNISSGGRLYLQSVVGSLGTFLNGSAHLVTTISGASYTLSATDTSTPSLVYSGGGYGAHYPQANTALRWVGDFDVPVRFDSDAMKVTLDAGYFKLWGEIDIVEIKVNSSGAG